MLSKWIWSYSFPRNMNKILKQIIKWVYEKRIGCFQGLLHSYLQWRGSCLISVYKYLQCINSTIPILLFQMSNYFVCPNLHSQLSNFPNFQICKFLIFQLFFDLRSGFPNFHIRKVRTVGNLEIEISANHFWCFWNL